MDLVERVHVTKIMLIQYLNMQHLFQGKRLEEIQIEGTGFTLSATKFALIAFRNIKRQCDYLWWSTGETLNFGH